MNAVLLPLKERCKIAIEKLEESRVIMPCSYNGSKYKRVFGEIDGTLTDKTIVIVFKEYINPCPRQKQCCADCNILNTALIYRTEQT